MNFPILQRKNANFMTKQTNTQKTPLNSEFLKVASSTYSEVSINICYNSHFLNLYLNFRSSFFMYVVYIHKNVFLLLYIPPIPKFCFLKFWRAKSPNFSLQISLLESVFVWTNQGEKFFKWSQKHMSIKQHLHFAHGVFLWVNTVA